MTRQQGPIDRWMTRARASAVVLPGVIVMAASVIVATGSAGAATLVNPVAEVQNLLVSQGRESEFTSPALSAQIGAATAAYQARRLAVARTDPGRRPNPNPCTLVATCPIDPRLEHWAQHGGIVDPVLFTARSGATLSGHVWATKAGPPHRPAILIINGSIVGYEQVYWYVAQALARDGYVVLTFDAQGEGMSDQFGAAPDQLEGAFAGTPGLGPQLGGSGVPFYDGGEDAMNFLLSNPKQRYEPVLSRSIGTSHAGKQNARVEARLDPAYDPLWKLINRNEIGIAGHSYGAEAASWLGQADPRIKAIVAWDNLCLPVWPAPTETLALLTSPINDAPPGPFGLPTDCFGASAGPAPKLTKPALGISGDYLIPSPYTSAPDPEAKSQASLTYTKAGADTGQIMIRGGTHFEFSDFPSGLVPATLRGIDLVTWYSLAWFDRYLKDEPSANARLLTTRWRDDEMGGSVDPTHDPNLLSYHYRSRLDIHLVGGGTFSCENLQAGCPGQVASSADCGPADFSYLAVDTGESPVGCPPPKRPSNRHRARRSPRSRP